MAKAKSVHSTLSWFTELRSAFDLYISTMYGNYLWAYYCFSINLQTACFIWSNFVGIIDICFQKQGCGKKKKPVRPNSAKRMQNQGQGRMPLKHSSYIWPDIFFVANSPWNFQYTWQWWRCWSYCSHKQNERWNHNYAVFSRVGTLCRWTLFHMDYTVGLYCDEFSPRGLLPHKSCSVAIVKHLMYPTCVNRLHACDCHVHESFSYRCMELV